jgi:hypothetical protein
VRKTRISGGGLKAAYLGAEQQLPRPFLPSGDDQMKWENKLSHCSMTQEIKPITIGFFGTKSRRTMS